MQTLLNLTKPNKAVFKLSKAMETLKKLSIHNKNV